MRPAEMLTAASRGAIGGAAGDAGVEYRRAVAAYVVTHGLADVALSRFGFRGSDAIVANVSLETDDPVDDLRVTYTAGGSTFVQAKRRLTDGPLFVSAVEQWKVAAQRGLDPKRHRLVIAAGSLSGPMRQLQALLDRASNDTLGGLTQAERRTLRRLDQHLEGLTPPQRATLLRCAAIVDLEVEEPTSTDARAAIGLLGRTVCAPQDAEHAWRSLVASAGRLARRRAGLDVSGWQAELRAADVELSIAGDTRSARLERTHRAVERYKSDLRRAASELDLRGLGAAIPPIPLDTGDAQVEVHLDPDDSRDTGKLAWVALRRGRVVLTGLPGGGKSTAMAAAAAQLVDVPHGPLPVLVSLREMFARDRASGFHHRLLSTVSERVRTVDRQLIEQVIEERLDDGRIVLLLDALDETYERRGEVVEQLHRFLDGVDDDVGVVLATRDVAYGQAATLGWSSVRLATPEKIEKTVEAILQAATAALPAVDAAASRAKEWASERAAWVSQALARDATLTETPLLPILLTLLAAERDVATLPTGRARILLEVVDAVVDRHERRRRDQFAFGVLEATDARDAALVGFAAEAAAISAGDGSASVEAVVDAAAAALRDRWGLSAGHAASAARDIVRFWDEHGVFVVSNDALQVAPRIALFAEVGDARMVTQHPSDLESWVSGRYAAGKVEPLILAAGLSPVAARVLASLTTETTDRALAHAVVQAVAEGAVLSDDQIEGVRQVLRADARTPDRDGWRSWVAAARLPGADHRSIAMSALDAYPPEYTVLASAHWDLAERDVDELRATPERLLAVLGTHRLAKLSARGPASGPDWRDSTIDGFLGSTQLRIAELLIGSVPQAAEIALKTIGDRPARLHDQLLQLLSENGYAKEVRALRAAEREEFVRRLGRFADFDADQHRRLLAMIAELSEAVHLTPGQATRMDELADFVETLDLNDVSAWPLIRWRGDLPGVLRLIAVLGGFDLGLLSAQAGVVVERIEAMDDNAPFFSLFDRASRRDLDRWTAVDDHGAAVRLMSELFTLGRSNAFVALNAFWHFPEPELAAPTLRELVPRVSSSPEHEWLVALALYSLRGTPEPECWLDADDPVLRTVLARTCPATLKGRINPTLRTLLHDADGNVRAEAVRRLENVRAAGRRSLLTEAATSSNPGWTCWSCRTPNPPERLSCLKDGCHLAAPDPADIARRLLRGESPPDRSRTFVFEAYEEKQI